MSRLALCLVLLCTHALAGPDEDLAQARALFERNLRAIELRDRAAYLACYLPTEGLVRNGFGGLGLGFDDLVSSTGDGSWPDRFEARDLRVLPVTDGVVYGQYRYRVTYGERVAEGISERIFLRTAGGWRIAVSTAFEAGPGALPPIPEGDSP